MRLNRDVNKSGRGKYAIVKLRKMPSDPGKRADCEHAMRILFENRVLTYGLPNTTEEFFVVMLKDEYAYEGLQAYAKAAKDDGNIDYAADIFELLARTGRFSPFRKRPD
jgi:hypothetical protein